MAEHPAEVTDITASAGALMLNLGNITDARIESMKRSMRTAMENKIPVLLDLVGVACSDLRLDLARELLRIGHPAVLKGNMSELLAVSGLPSHAIGIDAGVEDALTEENIDGVSEVLKAFSRNNQAIVLATGKQDFVTDGERVVLVQNGSAALSGITGTGCMVGALTAAFLPGCEDNIAKEMTDRIEAGTIRHQIQRYIQIFSIHPNPLFFSTFQSSTDPAAVDPKAHRSHPADLPESFPDRGKSSPLPRRRYP